MITRARGRDRRDLSESDQNDDDYEYKLNQYNALAVGIMRFHLPVGVIPSAQRFYCEISTIISRLLFVFSGRNLTNSGKIVLKRTKWSREIPQ